MTIKTDRAVCLTLPRSLVRNHGPTEDVFLFGGCLGCREWKPGELAPVKKEFMGAWERLLENPWQEIQSGLKGAESLVLWSSLGLSASCFHAALLFCLLTSLSAHPWPLALWLLWRSGLSI